jgi:1-acyl-sn-glycerol-3-phosphate acyltransferase
MVIAIRSALFNGGFILWTLVLGLTASPLFLMPRRASVGLARLWIRGAFFWLRLCTSIRHEVRGREHIPQHTGILASKHQSAWETMAFYLLLRDPAFVLKKELLSIPVFGWYLRHIGMIAIDRSAGQQALQQIIAQGREAMADGRQIVIFPEGTRVAPGTKKRYHRGVVALQEALQLPITPVALNSGLCWERNAFVKKPGCITIQFLRPIYPSNRSAEEVLKEVEAVVEGASDALLSAPLT